MNKRFDELLGKLSLKEKLAQMMVFGVSGVMPDPWLLDFTKKYGLGGLRISPNGSRKFSRYLPQGAKGSENVNRPPQLHEKFVDAAVHPPFYSAKAYAQWLNDFRTLAWERGGLGLPVHMVADCESYGGNFAPPYLMSMPNAMGFGDAGAVELLERGWCAMAKQLKAIGIDWIHSPVVDVNMNPNNPEISTRSFGADPDLVTRCAAANLRGLKAGNVIGTLKHFPGRGDSAQDAHYGLPVIHASKTDMMDIHVKPYRELIGQGLAEAVMLAHTVFPNLDPDAEVATVSKFLIKELLRGELGFNGVITTDSITMGGLMARYSVAEAAIRTINFGTDLILLKDENSLRGELIENLEQAVKDGRIRESRIDESVLRVWKLKDAYGLFENGGIVDVTKTEEIIENPEFQTLSEEMSRTVRRTLRMEKGILPLTPAQNLLVIDRVTDIQINRNDYWNRPSMFYDFLRKYTDNLTYIDYNGKNTDRALGLAEQFKESVDVILITTDYDRSDVENASFKLVRDLQKLGKPVIQLSSNPYHELMIPEESKNVVLTYGLMREQLESAAAWLFGKDA